jgi:hypothetical protein
MDMDEEGMGEKKEKTKTKMLPGLGADKPQGTQRSQRKETEPWRGRIMKTAN